MNVRHNTETYMWHTGMRANWSSHHLRLRARFAPQLGMYNWNSRQDLVFDILHYLYVLFSMFAIINPRGSYRIYSLGGGGGGGGNPKHFGVYVMAYISKPQVGGLGLPPPDFFARSMLSDWFWHSCILPQNLVTQLHLATEYTIIIRKANHRIIAHGQNILDYDTITSCHRIYTNTIRKANHRIIAHGQNILD